MYIIGQGTHKNVTFSVLCDHSFDGVRLSLQVYNLYSLFDSQKWNRSVKDD